MKESRTISKTLGNGQEIEVPNPFYYDSEGNFKKRRLGGNNRKKKKRKSKRK